MTDDGTADALAVATIAARAADEKQGRGIVVLDVGDILAIAELFVVLDAPNRRLVRTLVDEIEEAVRAATGRSPRRVEGIKEQQWVLIDYGDVVVHVFLDEVEASRAGTVASVPAEQIGTEGVEPVSTDDIPATTTT